MADLNPTSITLEFHTVKGELSDHTVTFYAPFHRLGPFDPSTIRTIQVGARVALYGNVLKNVDGVNVQDYIHLRGGAYTFEKPIQLLTFHADLIS